MEACQSERVRFLGDSPGRVSPAQSSESHVCNLCGNAYAMYSDTFNNKIVVDLVHCHARLGSESNKL